MPKPNHNEAISYAFQRLQTELAPELTYHNLYHTQEDIMPAVGRLAALCQVDPNERDLLLVAAAYHDIGFIVTYHGHEQAGAIMMAQVLPNFGYSDNQIDRLVKLVLATRQPSTPTDLLGKIMVDSDLDVLGRDDFIERNEALRQEVSFYHNRVGRRQWLEGQLVFIKEHTYLTTEALTLRGDGKQRNIGLLREELKGLSD